MKDHAEQREALMDVVNELEAAAKAATPGPWCSSGEYGVVVQTSQITRGIWDIAQCNHQPLLDSKYIALANPHTILQLTSALRTAIGALEDMSQSGCLWKGIPFDGCPGCKAELKLKALASISAAVGGKGGTE